MNTTVLFMGLLPLVIYIGIDAWKGFRAGIIAAMLTTIAMSIYDFYLFGELDKFMVGEGVMILLMGFISLKMNNDRYFKFQPTVLAFIFAGVFAWFQLFDKPLMLKFLPHIEKIMNSASAAEQSSDPRTLSAKPGLPVDSPLSLMYTPAFQNGLARLSAHLVLLFLVHGLIMGYAALYLSTRLWLAWRMSIYPAIFLLVVINQVLQ